LRVAEKCGFRPSGVKIPEGDAAFIPAGSPSALRVNKKSPHPISCLKARPTKFENDFAPWQSPDPKLGKHGGDFVIVKNV
jgi:hypothetical protein